jgi:hypothetical protein
MNPLKALDGKKTLISEGLFLFHYTILPIWFETDIPPTIEKVLLTVACVLGLFGIGHKAVKADKVNGVS